MNFTGSKVSIRILSAIIISLTVLLGGLLSISAEEAIIPGGSDFLEGRRLQNSGKWAASIEAFQRAVNIYSPVSDYALFQIAESATQISDWEKAAASLEALLGLYPETPVKRIAQVKLVNTYFEVGRLAPAAPLIRAALPGAESSRETAGLTLMLARAHAVSDLPRADSLYWQLIYGWPSTSEALQAAESVSQMETPQKKLAAAKVFYFNKKPEKALALSEEALKQAEIGSLVPELLLYKAHSLGRLGKTKAAMEIYQRIIDEYPDTSSTASALYSRAENLRSRGSTEEALEDLARLVERFPRSELAPQALLQRGRILERQDEPRASGEYERILREYSESYLAYPVAMKWGIGRFGRRDYSGARTVFRMLKEADLNSDATADAYFWLAKCAVAAGKTEEARRQLDYLITRFEDSYQSFRARYILQGLNEGHIVYSALPIAAGRDVLAYEREPFVSLEFTTAEEAVTSLESNIPYSTEQEVKRLRFLMLNSLSESEWELERIADKIKSTDGRYDLAWAFFHAQAYHDSLRLASSLRNGFSERDKKLRLHYLLYPIAYPELLYAATRKYDVDPLLTLAVMREESHFREKAVSSSDAHGLMQILPSTGEWLAGKMFGPVSFQSSDLFVPSVNVEIGNYYLRYLLDRFDNNIVYAVAAYNWGETNLRRWLAENPQDDFDVFVESIPADETRRYVKKVLRSLATYHRLYPHGYLTGFPA